MSADLLREAAALMRERADLPYVTGSWTADGHYIRKTSSSPRIGFPAHAEASCCLYEAEDEKVTNEAIAAHIASWHPAVALAVADLLDLVAIRHTPHDRSRIVPEIVCDHDQVQWPCDHMTWALAVARAYLGRGGP